MRMEFKRLVHSKVKTIGGYVFRPAKFVPFFRVARFHTGNREGRTAEYSQGPAILRLGRFYGEDASHFR